MSLLVLLWPTQRWTMSRLEHCEHNATLTMSPLLSSPHAPQLAAQPKSGGKAAKHVQRRHFNFLPAFFQLRLGNWLVYSDFRLLVKEFWLRKWSCGRKSTSKEQAWSVIGNIQVQNRFMGKRLFLAASQKLVTNNPEKWNSSEINSCLFNSTMSSLKEKFWPGGMGMMTNILGKISSTFVIQTQVWLGFVIN